MLLGLAAVFAVINGANDGGAMLASTLKVRGLRPIASLAIFATALVIVPLVLGTRVADTLTSGLVTADSATQASLVGLGVVAAIAVVGCLTAIGMPTSLTLGVVGGIVGAGLGRGVPVAVGAVGRVVLIGVAAPIVGAVLAMGLSRVVAAVLAVSDGGRVAVLHRIATVLQAVAYAANDGQKMLVVVAVTSIGVNAPTLLAVAALFAVGSVLGVGASADTLGRQILRATPREEVTAQFAASLAVLGSAVLGAPVSMTQAVSGGLVGTGMLRGRRQVRWRVAEQLAVAWVVTLPSALLAGAMVAWLVGRLT